MKKIRNILCYSYNDFNNIMETNGWFTDKDLPKNVAIISIGAPWNEGEGHWFKNSSSNVLNIDFDDASPTQWWNGQDLYDKAKEDTDQSKYFSYTYTTKFGKTYLHAFDYNQAQKLVVFIETHNDCDFYIHCSAGISRSQGVVRYILDTYSDEFDINTNPDNPCLCPNTHVVLMLKRAFKNLYYDNYNIDNSHDLDEISKQ